MTYQAWQTQWNQAMSALVRAYHAMAGTHETNTLAMNARDQAEAANGEANHEPLGPNCSALAAMHHGLRVANVITVLGRRV